MDLSASPSESVSPGFDGSALDDVEGIPGRRSWISTIRLVSVSAGLGSVVFAELITPSTLQNVLSVIGVLGLVIAGLIALSGPRLSAETTAIKTVRLYSPSVWRWTGLSLGIASGLLIQTWFRPGMVIAGGDITPPIGTAWIGRVFSSFAWNGNNLGGPVNNQTDLPWAVVSELTHLLGGSGGLAQRVWYTLLVVSIFVVALILARVLGLSPVAGVVVAVFYFFNPMTMSQVGLNDVYLAAMVLLVALPSVLISFSLERIRLWQLNVVFMIAAPLAGYVFINPPLLVMVAVVVGCTPLIVWVRFGRGPAYRALRGMFIGGMLLLAASSYWIEPSLVALTSTTSGGISDLSAWAFTESRSTLANGLWLNTTWGWAFSLYYPFAGAFAHFPLRVVRVLVPVSAFILLAIWHDSDNEEYGKRRLAGLIAVSVLGVVILSNGTRLPGSLLFDPLYHLPLGWVLREPGRFLMATGLGYAVLVGLLVEHLRKNSKMTLQIFGHWLNGHAASMSFSSLVALGIVALALISSFPLWTGAIVPGLRQGFPSSHVTVPPYWKTTAGYLNSRSAPSGSLLVLPPDDFYQMPYTWYYGNEAFIPDLLNRGVVVPNAQGYSTVSNELISAVKLEATAIQDHRWKVAGRLLTAIGTPIILVRGDIQANFPGRSIVSPMVLSSGLALDPEMKIVFHAGPLSLFELRAPYRQTPATFATVNTSVPNLLDLSILNQRTALVTMPAQKGHMAIYQLPSVATWKLGPTFLSTQLPLPIGWSYTVRSIESGSVMAGAKVTQSTKRRNGQASATISIPIASNSAGDFSTGTWGPVANCNDVLSVKPPEILSSSVIGRAAPGGESALQLSASVDSACVGKKVSWNDGPLKLHLWSRSLSAVPPRICVWEEPLNRCAAAPPLLGGSNWTQYNTIIHPDGGTTKIILYLYADNYVAGKLTTVQYSDIEVESYSSAPSVVVVGTQNAVGLSRIVTNDSGYSLSWAGSDGTDHVLVDGLRNGWILVNSSKAAKPPVYLGTSDESWNEVALTVVFVSVAWVLSRFGRHPKFRFKRALSEREI